MSAEIIPFQSARTLKRVGPHLLGGAAPQSSLERQMARIARLVRELEGLSAERESCPLDVRERATATIEKARRVLKPYERSIEAASLDGEDDDVDPQPEIDRELMERLYRELNSKG